MALLIDEPYFGNSWWLIDDLRLVILERCKLIDEFEFDDFQLIVLEG